MVNPEAEVSDIQEGIDEVRRSLGKDQDYIPTGRLLKQRHKINTDLNFNYESHPEYNKRLLSHYKGTKDVLPFLHDESDGLVLDMASKAKSGEEKAQIRQLTPNSVMIGNLARIMQNYLGKSSKLVAAHQNIASREAIQIDRFFGTHSINLECLVLKLMEMKFGKEYAEEYMNRKGHQNGFIDYHDGVEFDITVDSQENPGAVTLKFGDIHSELTTGDLKSIVEEADKYSEEVEKRLEGKE